MPGIRNGLPNVRPLVERGIVHHDHRVFRQFRNQVLSHPGKKDIGINRAGKQADGQQAKTQQCADDIGAAFGVPVLRAEATPSNRRIPPAARHVVGKPAFVNENNRFPGLFIGFHLPLEGLPRAVVGFGVLQSFFYS